jgi:hypothetical protein
MRMDVSFSFKKMKSCMFWNETPITVFRTFSIMHGDFWEHPSHLQGKFWSCADHTRHLIPAQTV